MVELMMAMTTLALVMLMLFSTFLSASELSRVNRERHRALMDATSLAEQMAIMPIGNIATTFPNNQDIAEFTNLHVNNERVRVVYANGDATARPLRYQVVVTWTGSGGRPGRYVLNGVRAR